jgi:hypothetical protein
MKEKADEEGGISLDEIRQSSPNSILEKEEKIHAQHSRHHIVHSIDQMFHYQQSFLSQLLYKPYEIFILFIIQVSFLYNL